MKKSLFILSIVIIVLIINGCSNNSVKGIKADYVDIGLGQSLYEGYNKVEQESVQSLVNSYNQLQYIGQTNQQLNYDKAISIIFVYHDKISGTLMIDDKGIFHTDDSTKNYQIASNNDTYEQALKIYKDLKQKY
ncbi:MULTISPECIES: hypothetical protein [Priestia]|uniref:hypothetical protein n=1 Tax=Priestia TaxID=2800373 RepID=UPI000BFA96AC|nr:MULTISPECIES: hypothetical protein [Priestia]PFW73823.1 hypothetical protein COL23_19090 [Priestia aryabhattai]